VGVHNVFHVSQLKKCLEPQTDVVVEDTIVLEPNLTNKAYPIKVLEQDRVTQNKTTRFYKVQWNNLLEDEATWEREDYLRPIFRTFYPRGKPTSLPHNFIFLESRDEISSKEEGSYTPYYRNPNEVS
jgi:hypothetical protein